MALACYKVTVEPVLFLYMLGMFILLPALQDLIYTKVCLEKFSRDVCDDLYSGNNSVALDTVQTDSSHWILGSTLCLALTSIVTAQFLGSWSDTFGRKIPMLLPPLGAVFASFVYIVMSVKMTEAPVSLVLLASAITGIGGGFTSCIMTCMSYVAQVSDTQTRTVHVGILESMIYVGGTLGPMLGGWLQQAWGRSTTFTFIMAIHSAIIVYIVIFVRNIRPRRPAEESWVKSGCSFHHLRRSVTTVLKQRQENRRTCLLWLLAAASVVMFCTAGEIDISYLYVKDKPIEWPFVKYTWYFSLKYGLGVVALVVVLPLCSRAPDMLLVVAGLLGKMAGLVILALAWNDATVFSSAAVALLGSWPVSILRAAMSKLVEPSEQGKLFAFVALLENSCTLLASGVFNSVYPATRHILHGFTFYMAAVFLLIPILVVSLLHQSLLRINTIEFEELSEERIGRGEEEEEEIVQPESLPSQAEEADAVLAKGRVEEGSLDGMGEQCIEEQSLSTGVSTNDNTSVQ
ncbi:Proton-coupled folate transporter [Chionoecetes opilio]|uniref:Proton-coupled folate transporter n=1 Tax=Chionoecetes opilio TaxID=41210 RepID=A0A8J5CW52_CHIOP|nr:Proton-coupled folate transporter [Chionoecetes opilio]